MKQQLLPRQWTIAGSRNRADGSGGNSGSVYSALPGCGQDGGTRSGRDNVLEALALMDRDYRFCAALHRRAPLLQCGRVLLCAARAWTPSPISN